MTKIAAIVEGDGEVEAVPVLIRRIGSEVSPLSPPTVLRPIRVRRQRILKEGELERYVDQAALTARFNMAAARRRSPSFDKMWRATTALLQ